MVKGASIASSLLEILIIGMITIQPAFAETVINLSATETEIYATEKFLVTGTVSGEATYKPVRLSVYGPDGTLVFRPDVNVDNGNFKWVFSPPGGIYKQVGTYTVIASHENASTMAQLQFTVLPVAETMPITSLPQLANSQQVQSRPDVPIGNALDELPPSKIPDQVISRTTSPSQDYAEPVMAESTGTGEFVNSPEFATMVAIAIASVIIGVVTWMKIAHSREIVQR